jgi:hypothetical protein
MVREKCACKGKPRRPKGGGGFALTHQNQHLAVADSENSDEEFLGLGGISGRKKKGGWERCPRGLYRGGVACGRG